MSAVRVRPTPHAGQLASSSPAINLWWTRCVTADGEWFDATGEHHGVTIRYNASAEAGGTLAESRDVVLVATGGLPNKSFLDTGENLIDTTRALLGGHFDAIGGTIAPAYGKALYERPASRSRPAGD